MDCADLLACLAPLDLDSGDTGTVESKLADDFIDNTSVTSATVSSSSVTSTDTQGSQNVVAPPDSSSNLDASEFGNDLEVPGFAERWLSREVAPRTRSRSCSREHTVLLPIQRVREPRPKPDFRPALFNSMSVPSGVNSNLGSMCWAALVGRTPGSSRFGPNVMVMHRATSDDCRIAVAHATRAIEAIVNRRRSFYIGITSDPENRWEQHRQKRVWNAMQVLVEAADSTITSKLEQQILIRWRYHELCWNNSWGGESATSGRPHYVYVVEGMGRPRYW